MILLQGYTTAVCIANCIKYTLCIAHANSIDTVLNMIYTSANVHAEYCQVSLRVEVRVKLFVDGPA